MRRYAMITVLLLSLGVMGVSGAHPHGAGDPPCTVGEASPDGHVCFPTPEQCATGEFNGVWWGSTSSPPDGTVIRGAYCVGYDGQNYYYSGGNFPALCGTVIVYDKTVADNSPLPMNPNSCP